MSSESMSDSSAASRRLSMHSKSWLRRAFGSVLMYVALDVMRAPMEVSCCRVRRGPVPESEEEDVLELLDRDLDLEAGGGGAWHGPLSLPPLQLTGGTSKPGPLTWSRGAGSAGRMLGRLGSPPNGMCGGIIIIMGWTAVAGGYCQRPCRDRDLLRRWRLWRECLPIVEWRGADLRAKTMPIPGPQAAKAGIETAAAGANMSTLTFDRLATL